MLDLGICFLFLDLRCWDFVVLFKDVYAFLVFWGGRGFWVFGIFDICMRTPSGSPWDIFVNHFDRGSWRLKIIACLHEGVLGSVLEPGQQRDIDTIAECLEDRDKRVNQAAVEGLRKLVAEGNIVAIETVKCRLEHTSALVQKLANEVLQKSVQVKK